MKKTFLFFLILWVGSICLFAQNKLSTKRPPAVKYTQKKDYQRYEPDDIAPFRRKFAFEKPVPEPQIVLVEEADTLDRDRKVATYFTQGNSYFIDVNPFTTSLSLLHPKPVVSQVVTQAAPTYVTQSVSSSAHTRKAPTKVRGYRIQLFNGQDREEANRVRSQFVANFPETPRYLMFVEPTYRVRIGDFYTRNDAENFLQNLKRISAFSDAIIIRDIVEFKEPKEEIELTSPPDEN